MRVIIALLSLCYMVMAGPMHMKPPIVKAVCDNPSFLIFPETGWCFAPNTQVWDIFLHMSSEARNRPFIISLRALAKLGNCLCQRKRETSANASR